ncbi:MAG TPA: disulfide bond formation protein B [Xanthobacteraceae bacterium]|jgi:disulfide bond formation protein DsbB|nr:disulfide bond formation protein B [Xanthobacteraceae bacterium]
MAVRMLDRMPKRIFKHSAVAAALTVAIGGGATILGAWFFQYGLKLQPCPLCLEQRIPYYVAIPLALVVAFAASRKASRALVLGGLGLIAAAMVVGAVLGAYHAGVEWQWWAGPQDCSGPLNSLGSAGGLMSQLQSIRVVRCDEAAWRFLGLSLAGYNVLISLALAAIAGWGFWATIKSPRGVV